MSARRRAATNLACAAIIVVFGLGSWWLWGRHLPLMAPSTSRIAGEQGREPADPLAIADLGGAEEPLAAITTLDRLRGLNTLADAELAAYQHAGASRVNVAVANYNDASKATVIVARTRNARTASRAASTLNELQQGYGFRSGELNLPGAAVLPAGSDGLPGGRAHYAHADLLVRVALRGPDASAAQHRFAGLLREQLEVVPASE